MIRSLRPVMMPIILSAVLLLGYGQPADGQGPAMTAEQAEREGIDLPSSLAVPYAKQAPTRPPSKGAPTELLLIPESTNDRVMAFDPMTGDLINADFIPADPDNLSTPIHAILGPDGTSILVSDQLDDVVQQYTLAGTYMGVFAPAGGVDNAILDNIRGIALRANGNLLVTVGGGANDDAVAEFDTNGNSVGNFIAPGTGGLDSPFDIVLGAEALVGGITSDIIHRFDLTGMYIADLAPINNFPEQIAIAASNGNILVANFGGTQEGVVEFTPAGAVVGVYDPASLGGYRGAYELPNGNILTTNGGGVHEIDRMGNLVETKIAGVSARFIERVQLPVPVGLQLFSVE